MSARQLVIAGRVQGVGYRDWLVGRAQALGVSGWVRNRRDGTVEAIVEGDAAAVEQLLRACRRGPRLADVHAVEETPAEPYGEPGFRKLPTA